MSEYGMRLKYEMVAKFLNDHGVYTSEDGDALFIKDDDSPYWVEEKFNAEGDPSSTWVVRGSQGG